MKDNSIFTNWGETEETEAETFSPGQGFIYEATLSNKTDGQLEM